MADDKNLSDLLKASGYDVELPNHDILKALPTNVKRRVCALKKVQLKSIEVESKFYERVHQLEREFEAEFAKFHDERKKIISGEHEPTSEESDIPLIHGATEEELKELNEGCSEDAAVKGIPDFWFTVLKTCEATSDMIQEHDDEILKHLTDITTSVENGDDAGFTLYFHFSPNPFFKNSILKKQYKLQMRPDPEDPFDFDGPSVVKTIGDEIQWEDGKNVTKKVIKKKQKKGANAGKFLTKTVKADSFFNFFEPPVISEGDHKNEDDDDESKKTGSCADGCCGEHDEEQELLRMDFEIGQVLRDHVVPRAVLFFTGEATDGDMFDDEFEDGDEDGDGSDLDEDEE